MGERTGSRVLQWVWSHVMGPEAQVADVVMVGGGCRGG
ncbi:hypothetical protein CTRU02_205910 [Colletotrichum truncatum]|uniref:Uncharacterized protein n=1 Tax=Colletotrichum truncatum TaxID=5467 RepID=A0ACC3Z5P5_COLTU